MSRKIRTIIDGNAFYEIDEECCEKLRRQQEIPENKKKNRESKQKEENEDLFREQHGKSGA